jgi:hypothetical protein
MGSVRLSSDRERVYALLSFTPLGEVVLGSEDGVAVVAPPDGAVVEVQCDVCGRWTPEVYPRPADHDGAVWHCAYCLRR